MSVYVRSRPPSKIKLALSDTRYGRGRPVAWPRAPMLDDDAARVASSFIKLDGLSLDDEASEPSQRSRAKTKDQAPARSTGRPSKASKPRRERVKFLRLTAEEEDVDL